jgi:hypothetical protein
MTRYQRAKRIAVIRAALCAATPFFFVTIVGPSLG